MAQKRRAAAGAGENGSGSRARSTKRARSTGRRRSARQPQAAAGREQRIRVSGGTSSRAQGRARRLLAEARDMAQSVGQSTLGTARGLASGAKDAAVGVANRTGDTAVQLAAKVRENPWPAVLIGAGATWIAIDAAREERSEKGRRGAGDRGRRDQGPSAARQAIATVTDAGRSVGERLGQFVRDNPVLAGAATLGIGVAVGLALPSTVTENEVLGQARDAVVNRAKEAGRSTVRSVRQVAEGATRLVGRS